LAEKKIVVVAGATGAQGGGLARAILNDPESPFSVRALTRDVRSPAALELAQAGAETVAADVEDAASLRRAFEGAYAAFCVTFFWAHFSPEKEIAHAGNYAGAAREAGLEHVIWSTLEDTRQWIPLEDTRMPTLMGRYKVPHFDAKGEADGLFAGLPVTYLLTSFYWDNLIHFGMGPRRGADGRLVFALPMGTKKLPGIAVEDIGRCAYGILKQPGSWMGRRVGVAGEHLTGDQMASALSRRLGEAVLYQSIPFDVYRALGFPGAEDLGNMFQFKHDFEESYCAARDVNVARSLNPALQTFSEWLAAEGHRLSVPPAATGS
jgi:uncharacterized protein YbjT (DUF2867 family)